MREEQTLPEMRAAFEAHHASIFGRKPLTWREAEGAPYNVPEGMQDNYYVRSTQQAWDAWQAGFNAGRAEGGKDAERYRVLKPMFVAANFHPEDLDLGGNGVVLMFLAPDEITVCSDLNDVIDSAIACLPTPPAAMTKEKP